MSEEPKDSSAPEQVEQELSGLEPQELLYALGVDFDIDAQLAAIHGLLRRNREGAAEIAEEIKSAEDRARHLRGVLNDWAVDDWVDRVHHSAYQEAAHSMAAVGMLAPFVETVLHQCFLGIGNRLYPIASEKKSHDRWKAAHALEWDCHYYISKRGADKNLPKWIHQLATLLALP